MMNNKNYWNLGATLSLAAVLTLTGQAALAAVSGSVVNAGSLPGGQASPAFVFSFDSGFDLAGFEVKFTFNPAKLSFDAAASTLAVAGGITMPATTIPLVLTAMQSASSDFFYSGQSADYDVDGFNFSFNGTYLNPANFSPIPGGTTVTLTGVFNLLPGFDSGSASVRVFGEAIDPAFNSEPFDVTATVSAVPEPETWLMVIGGLGLIASRVRRRAKR